MALADPYTRPMPRPVPQPARPQAMTPDTGDTGVSFSGAQRASDPRAGRIANQFLSQNTAQSVTHNKNAAKPPIRSNSTAMQYQRAQVETASPTRLIILLYEGAIRFCQLGLDAMAQQDLAGQHTNLLKAQRIVSELLGSLNRDQGGEVADNLSRLYTHMLEELVKANLYDQREPIETVQGMLRDLRDSWIEVERLTNAGDTMQNVTGNAAPPRMGACNA